MKTLIALGTLALALAFAPTAGAQEDTVIRQEDRTVFKKKTVIDFTDLSITGELTKPEGSYSIARRKTNFQSLLKARAHFMIELEASVDNL